ncbi:hypothetical protein AB0B30_15150 [Streptomyces narbonensis]|uniref:Uncharacterized protein n=1 Tax=Streptomyces narbonensis TaxID=67333 RepID=A0ABV3CGL7_9ACTN
MAGTLTGTHGTDSLTETATVDASETDPTPGNGNDTVSTCP